jgi:hypothetical protein
MYHRDCYHVRDHYPLLAVICEYLPEIAGFISCHRMLSIRDETVHCERRIGGSQGHYVAEYVARYVHYVWCRRTSAGTLVADGRDYHGGHTLDPNEHWK